MMGLIVSLCVHLVQRYDEDIGRISARVQGATVLIGYCMPRESMRLDLLEVRTTECRKEGGLAFLGSRMNPFRSDSKESSIR
jgi:hypothetical protein